MGAIHSEVIQNLERKMIPVKRAMEERGLNIDQPKLWDLIEVTAQQKKDLEEYLRRLLHVEGAVNFNSARDVSYILANKLGVEPKRTKSGRFSTSRQILKDFHNPLTDEIARYRDLEKLLSSLRAILKATDKVRGKISCTYVDSCPSGRLYSKDYNLQGFSEVARRVVCADKGCTFILADYDSFELRIISALSHDKYFKDCWLRGLDLHRKVISDMKNIPYESVTNKERKLGKALNFGIAYGQEPVGLARNLHISIPEAENLMRAYKKNIPEIEQFKAQVVAEARLTGFTVTYHGRKRFLPDITSPRISERRKTERQAVNTKIQGTGADIVKLSLVNLRAKGYLIDTMLHDGILITVPDGEVRQSLSHIKEIMETEIEGMKFTVTLKTGKTWSECY